MLISVLFIAAVTFIVWYCLTRWQQLRSYPPGPMPYPLVGNMPALLSKEKLWIEFENMQKKYGSIFTVFFATKPTIVLGSLDLIREAFITKQNDFAGRPESFSMDVFSKNGKDIAAGQYGPEWKQLRKIAHAAIRKYASGEILANTINESARKTFVEMDKIAESGERFNPQHCVNMIIYNNISSMVFGKTYEHNDPFLMNLIRDVDKVNESFGTGLLADFFPVFKNIPTTGVQLIKRTMAKMHKMVEEVYTEHEKIFDESDPKDFVDFMLQSLRTMQKDEGEESTEGLTEEHFQLVIMDLFSGGTDTSRLTLLWAIQFMAAYPETQKKLQEEVDSVVDRDEPLRMDHRAGLPYTEAFLHELLRIRPIAPLALFHSTTCETSVGGYTLPAGTQVIPNLWSVHMDPNEWGDPEVFRPERFLNDAGKMGPRISAWLPFSTGRRVCVGEALAKAELHLQLATLTQRYNFATPPGVQMDLSGTGVSQFLTPTEFEIILTKRS